VFEVDDAGLVADGLDEGAQAEVAGAAQQAFAGADDEGERFRGEGVVAEAGVVELVEEELFDRLGSQAWQQRRVGGIWWMSNSGKISSPNDGRRLVLHSEGTSQSSMRLPYKNQF